MRATEYKIQAYFDAYQRLVDPPVIADVSQAQQDGDEQQIMEQKEENVTA